ncbi:hypothetical protein CMV_030010 [Castanea mollissima]|uniref:Uncharacterized protein n=1 Tax=Castanea mollissima TaxID=60419 RepID=A0A8J4Q9E9_9ROSI|nr:hypothetical protein CMV_030010 [Castanea mollissima]
MVDDSADEWGQDHRVILRANVGALLVVLRGRDEFLEVLVLLGNPELKEVVEAIGLGSGNWHVAAFQFGSKDGQRIETTSEFARPSPNYNKLHKPEFDSASGFYTVRKIGWI